MGKIIKAILIISILISILLCIFYGRKNYTEIADCKKTELIAPEREHKVCQSTDLKNLNIEKKKEELGNIIKQKINSEFDTSDYVIDFAISGSDEEMTKIYDLTFTIATSRTNIGYVIFVNDDDTIVESIFDNMQGYKASVLKSKYEDTIKGKIDNLQESRIENMRKKALEIPEGSTYVKIITGEGTRYDILKNKLYYTISYEGKNKGIGTDFSSMFADVYEEEI
jgi:hypothetical protein